MFEIYEKLYGFDSEKSAKICMELAQIYELQADFNNAIEYYKNSYTIWEKILKENNSEFNLKQDNADTNCNEVFITISIKLAELFEKSENFQNAYEILKVVKNKYILNF